MRAIGASPIWRFCLSLLAAAAVLWLAFYLVDLGELWQVLLAVDYRYLVPAVILYFASLWLRVMRWRVVLSASGNVNRPVSLYASVMLGYAANNVLPARLGEAVRAWAFCRRNPGYYGGTVFASILVERIFDCFFLSALGAASLVALLWAGHLDESRLATAVLLVALLCGVAGLSVGVFGFLVSTGGRSRCRRMGRLLALVPSRFRRSVFRWLVRAGIGIDGMRSVDRCRRVLGWTAAAWLTEALVFLCVAQGFGLDGFPGGIFVVALAMAVAMAASNFGSAVPLSLGGLGFFEAAASQSLVLVGVSPEVALAHSLTVHLLVSWVPVNVAGLLVVLWWAGSRFTKRRFHVRSTVG